MNEWRKGDGLLMSTSADMMFQTLADTRTTLTHDSRGPTRWEKQTKEKKKTVEDPNAGGQDIWCGMCERECVCAM